MTHAQDKLGLGILTFLVFFVIAFLMVPRAVYTDYFAAFKSRARRAVIVALAVGVFTLAIPYFYEILVGFDNRALAKAIRLLIGLAAYGVLLDVGRFVFKAYWMPMLARRRRR